MNFLSKPLLSMTKKTSCALYCWEKSETDQIQEKNKQTSLRTKPFILKCVSHKGFGAKTRFHTDKGKAQLKNINGL